MSLELFEVLEVLYWSKASSTATPDQLAETLSSNILNHPLKYETQTEGHRAVGEIFTFNNRQNVLSLFYVHQ